MSVISMRLKFKPGNASGNKTYFKKEIYSDNDLTIGYQQEIQQKLPWVLTNAFRSVVEWTYRAPATETADSGSIPIDSNQRL